MKNVASGNDRLLLQVGRIVPVDEQPTPVADTRSSDEHQPMKVTNIRSGNATVGLQVEEIDDDLDISF